jgi:CRISPR/Cas system-associated exonuclease Cas4 (RecB family)
MQLTAANRREVIEDLLDISIFSSMGKLLKDRVAENREDVRETEYQMQLVESKIDTQQQYIRKLKEQSDDTIATFQKMVDEARLEVSSISSNNASMIAETDSLLDKIKDSDSITLKSNKVFDLINKLRSRHDKAHKRIGFFESHDEFPKRLKPLLRTRLLTIPMVSSKRLVVEYKNWRKSTKHYTKDLMRLRLLKAKSAYYNLIYHQTNLQLNPWKSRSPRMKLKLNEYKNQARTTLKQRILLQHYRKKIIPLLRGKKN